MTELAHEHSNVKVCLVQLPGLNTPQFNWNLKKMDAHAMPVPPSSSPSCPPKRSSSRPLTPAATSGVGISTAYTILGERLAPSFRTSTWAAPA